ncbi:B12-binding domain-containing radical SAM protein [bacterium]|nr:B12-binding domain-containing radical SAM protein [candidate division CSSED10-310 bacterium]
MKVLLLTTENTLVCFGLRQVAASLREDCHEVHSLFMPKEFDGTDSSAEIKAVDALVTQLEPDLIGFSLMSSHMNRTRRLSSHLREEFPEIDVVWGGIHPTLAPEECLSYADYVIVGEGEMSSRLLLEALETGGDLATVAGVCYIRDGAMVRVPCASRLPDLDTLPFADFELESQFILHEGEVHQAEPELMRYYVPGMMDAHYVLSSRGCPHSCSYCCNSALRKVADGPYLRRRSPGHFIGEMVYIREQLPYIKGFVFMDDSFLYGENDWFETFCSRYREHVGLPFLCWANPTAVREEIIEQLVQVGLVGVHVGLESGSERITRGVYNRPVSNERFLECMDILARYKDKIVDRRVDIITDNPYETEEDTIASIRLLATLEKPFFLGIVSLLFYPMTALTERAAADGKLPETSHIYVREFFHYQPTYLNRLMRTIPLTPGPLIELFVRLRSSKAGRLIFYLYYFGYFVAVRRQSRNLRRRLTLWVFKRFGHLFPDDFIVTTRIAMIDF